MAVLATIAFATLLLEDDDFVAFYKGLSHFAYNFCTCNGGSSDSNGSIVVYKENTVELNCVALLAFLAQVVDIEETSGLSLKLLALNFYDNVHW